MITIKIRIKLVIKVFINLIELLTATYLYTCCLLFHCVSDSCGCGVTACWDVLKICVLLVFDLPIIVRRLYSLFCVSLSGCLYVELDIQIFDIWNILIHGTSLQTAQFYVALVCKMNLHFWHFTTSTSIDIIRNWSYFQIKTYTKHVRSTRWLCKPINRMLPTLASFLCVLCHLLTSKSKLFLMTYAYERFEFSQR
jgi:hypothetical protein